jgi:hypothetical protein
MNILATMSLESTERSFSDFADGQIRYKDRVYHVAMHTLATKSEYLAVAFKSQKDEGVAVPVVEEDFADPESLLSYLFDKIPDYSAVLAIDIVNWMKLAHKWGLSMDHFTKFFQAISHKILSDSHLFNVLSDIQGIELGPYLEYMLAHMYLFIPKVHTFRFKACDPITKTYMGLRERISHNSMVILLRKMTPTNLEKFKTTAKAVMERDLKDLGFSRK